MFFEAGKRCVAQADCTQPMLSRLSEPTTNKELLNNFESKHLLANDHTGMFAHIYVRKHTFTCLLKQARQLESLARLAEARARVELRQVVTREDAEVCGRVAIHCLG